jgi:glycosyltransferase involved in cell wall biosynthesis
MSVFNPMVSIIIPTYNRASLITETLYSVLNQTYQNWECIIVDDLSTDQTMELIALITEKDNRFVVVSNKRWKGACGARNTGVEIATGSFLIFLDADDLLSENCLLNRVTEFEQKVDCDFLVFSTIEFKKRIDDTNILINVYSKDDLVERFLNLDIPWLTTGPIWRRDRFVSLGTWNEEMLSWQDWELHIRALLNNYKFSYYATVDNYWRFDSEIASIGQKSIGIDHRLSIFNSTKAMRVQMKDNPVYIQRLNGLVFWIAERFLEQGDFKLAREAFNISQKGFPFLNRMINGFGLIVLKRMIIKHPYTPNYGTTRKIFAAGYLESKKDK